MKICTITCHDVYNCGASLQAYALQQFLMLQGHHVEIINYKPNYLSVKYKFTTFVPRTSPYFDRCNKNYLIRLIYVTYRFFSSIGTIRRKFIFDNFTNNFLKLTSKYSSYKQLQENAPNADLYIVGSDQVWNSITLENGLDPAFYLQFVNIGRKISYAASFGANSISETNEKRIVNMLASLDSISVREQTAKNILEKFGLIAQIVPDPVFLLSKDEWEKCVLSKKNKSKCNKYVLIYSLSKTTDSLVLDGIEYAKSLGYDSIVASPEGIKINNVDSISLFGPIEFLSLIINAECIFSNSFHATAFSIIFQKEFYTYLFHSMSSSSRMIDLLTTLGLENRFVYDSFRNMNKIDYSSVNIKDYMNIGHEWLTNQINKVSC